MEKPFIPNSVSLEALEALSHKAFIREDARHMITLHGRPFIEYLRTAHMSAMLQALSCACPEHIARFQAATEVLSLVCDLADETGILSND